jgi:hypothetical protein
LRESPYHMRETGGPDTKIITTGLTIVSVPGPPGAVMFALAEISRNAGRKVKAGRLKWSCGAPAGEDAGWGREDLCERTLSIRSR